MMVEEHKILVEMERHSDFLREAEMHRLWKQSQARQVRSNLIRRVVAAAGRMLVRFGEYLLCIGQGCTQPVMELQADHNTSVY